MEKLDSESPYAAVIAAYRLHRQLRYGSIEEHCGIHESVLQEIERGAQEPTRIEKILLSNVLGLRPQVFDCLVLKLQSDPELLRVFALGNSISEALENAIVILEEHMEDE